MVLVAFVGRLAVQVAAGVGAAAKCRDRAEQVAMAAVLARSRRLRIIPATLRAKSSMLISRATCGLIRFQLCWLSLPRDRRAARPRDQLGQPNLMAAMVVLARPVPVAMVAAGRGGGGRGGCSGPRVAGRKAV